ASLVDRLQGQVARSPAAFKGSLELRGLPASPPQLVDPVRFTQTDELRPTVLTRLFQLTRAGSGLSDQERETLKATLAEMLPRRISSYLFEATGHVRAQPFDVSPLAQLIQTYRADLLEYLQGAFQQGWPVTEVALRWPPEDPDVHAAAYAQQLQVIEQMSSLVSALFTLVHLQAGLQPMAL